MSSTFGKRWSALKWDPHVWREYPTSVGEADFLRELRLLRSPPPALSIHQYMACVHEGVQRVSTDYHTSVAFWKEMELKTQHHVAHNEVLIGFTGLDGLFASADPVGEVHWKMNQLDILSRAQLQRPLVALPSPIDLWLEVCHRSANLPANQLERAPDWLRMYNDLFAHRTTSLNFSAPIIKSFIEALTKEDGSVVFSIAMKVLPKLGAEKSQTLQEASVQLIETLVPNMRDTFFWLHTRGLFLNAAPFMKSSHHDRLVHCLTTLATNSLQEWDKPLLAYLVTPYLGSNTAFEAWQHLAPDLRKEHVHRELLAAFEHPSHPKTLDNEPPVMQRFWGKMDQELQALRPWPRAMLHEIANNVHNTPLGRQLATAMDPRMEVIACLDDAHWRTNWHAVLNQNVVHPAQIALPSDAFAIEL